MKGSLRWAQPCICWYVFPSDESDCVAGHVVAKAAQSVCDIQFYIVMLSMLCVLAL